MKSTVSEALLKEIERVFPFAQMPRGKALLFHQDGCPDCESLMLDLQEYQSQPVTIDVIRLIHQEMPHLSADAWLWILPYFLRYCLTSEAEYTRMETEFLVYNLSPDFRFEVDTRQRLSGLNGAQIGCLIAVLEWLDMQEFWSEYCSENIHNALIFLRDLGTPLG